VRVAEIELLSVVALLRNVPEQKLVRGHVGTVVEELAPGVYLVDFCDDGGRSYAVATLRSKEMIRLHHCPVERVA
jgi:hypothetical protein